MGKFLRFLFSTAALALAPTWTWAQGSLLVAQPSLDDPNFERTVVLVAPSKTGGTVGVVLNRPHNFSLAQMMPEHPHLSRFQEPLRQGGPVDARGLFAVYSGPAPEGPSTPLSDQLHLVLEKTTIEEVMQADIERVRFYSGYAGWAPGQLQFEVSQGAWWVLDLDEEVVRRADPSALWDELSKRAQALTATLPTRPRPALASQP